MPGYVTTMDKITVCPGCNGCDDFGLDDFDELAALMSERPDGNSGPPAHCLHEWNPISEHPRTEVIARGRGRRAHSKVRVMINPGNALTQARAA